MRNIFLLFVSLCSGLLFGQVTRVEPPFWWKGMQDSQLQILLYGTDIAKFDVELSDNIQVEELQKTANANYLFLTINTEKIVKNNFTIRLKNVQNVVQEIPYELKERRANASQKHSFSSADVFYLIMPDRFANGNPNNDTVSTLTEKANRANINGRHGGDLQGIINNLDYLNNLGVTTLWLTPICEDNQDNYTYHGYAQTNLYKIDERYGTLADYKKLSTELKKRKMKLVMDYVTNHFGSHHWLMKDLPSKNWVHYFENEPNGFKRSNYKTSVQMNTNASKTDTELALKGWFDTTMPDLNQTNPQVLRYLIQNAIWWIEEADLDGFRVDTYPYNNKEAMATWIKAITNQYPAFNIVGEAWFSSPAQVAYWQKNSKVGEAGGYNSHLPSVMDFPLFSALPSFLKGETGWGRGAEAIYEVLSHDFLYPDIDNVMVFFENHDTERLNENFPNVASYKMALSLVATLRGMPQLYYGSEVGLRGDKNKGGDGQIRQDFPGGWQSDKQNAFSVKNQTKEQKAYHSFTQKILQWRKTKTAIHKGATTVFAPEQNVLVYVRSYENQFVMVFVNPNAEAKTLELSRFKEVLDGVKNAREIISEKQINLTVTEKIIIPEKTAYIVEFKK